MKVQQQHPFLAIFDDDFEMQEHRIRSGALSLQPSARLKLHVEMLSVFFVVLFRRAARLGGQLEILLNHPQAAIAVVAVPGPETKTYEPVNEYRVTYIR